MKTNIIKLLGLVSLLSACAYDDPEVQIKDSNYPFRMVIDEEGADLADAEDYGIEISFADYIGDLPSTPITLTYTLEGEGDFTGVEIDEIIYEYEDDDCVFEREISFDGSTITIPVDTDLGTVPEEFEIVVAFGLDADAEEGGFKLTITGIQSESNVLFNDASEFEYEILDNDLAGEWVMEFDEASFASFKEVFNSISADLAEISFEEITGEVKFEFEFEEMKIEIELVEEEEVTECENGEIETDTENLVIEIEAEYDAEDGELEMEESYLTEDGEELDFLIEASYEFDETDNLIITFGKIIDEDHYEDGDELYAGARSFTLEKD